jgi:ribulose-5-phosphate 4-epimerase/fuculose-1-phosphate aldolase
MDEMNEEARLRGEIAAYAARLYERGLVAGSSGNLSARLADGTLLVTPTGLSLGSLGPADIVACTSAGVARDAGQRPTSELPLHIAAYRVRDDVRRVIHTHPTYCVAWSKTQRLFPLDTVGAIESLGPITLVPYAKSGTQELAELCAATFARGYDTLVMERHGLSSAAADFETAFLRTDLAEQTAHIEFAAYLLAATNHKPIMNDDLSPGTRARNVRPSVPIDDFAAAAADHPEARAAIADFHTEYSADVPDHARLDAHAERVRGYASVAGPFERWWLDPSVQAFVAELNATGI